MAHASIFTEEEFLISTFKEKATYLRFIEKMPAHTNDADQPLDHDLLGALTSFAIHASMTTSSKAPIYCGLAQRIIKNHTKNPEQANAVLFAAEFALSNILLNRRKNSFGDLQCDGIDMGLSILHMIAPKHPIEAHQNNIGGLLKTVSASFDRTTALGGKARLILSKIPQLAPRLVLTAPFKTRLPALIN